MRISDWSSDVCSSDLGDSSTAEEVNGDGEGRKSRERSSTSKTHDSCSGGVYWRTIRKNGRASCGDRVRQYGYVLVVAVTLTNNNTTITREQILKENRSSRERTRKGKGNLNEER